MGIVIDIGTNQLTKEDNQHMIIRLTRQLRRLQEVRDFLFEREKKWKEDDELAINLLAQLCVYDEMIVMKVDLIKYHRGFMT